MKANIYAQNRSSPAGLVRVRKRRKIVGQAGPSTSWKDHPSQRPQGDQHLGNGLLSLITFSTLTLLCSGLAATLGDRYPPPGKDFFGSHYQVKEKGEEEAWCML